MAVTRAMDVVMRSASALGGVPSESELRMEAHGYCGDAAAAWDNLTKSLSLLGANWGAVRQRELVELSWKVCFTLYRCQALEVPWLKGHLVALANRCLDKPLPACPKAWKGTGERWGFMLSGGGYVMLNRLVRGVDFPLGLDTGSELAIDTREQVRRFRGFSLLQMKGIFPEGTERFLQNSVQGTFDRLTAPVRFGPLGAGCDCGQGPDCYLCRADPESDLFWRNQVRREIIRQGRSWAAGAPASNSTPPSRRCRDTWMGSAKKVGPWGLSVRASTSASMRPVPGGAHLLSM